MPRPILWLLTSIAAMLVAVGMMATLVPLRAAAEGFDVAAIGWIGGAYYGGFLAGPWLAAPMVRALGSGKAFAAAAAAGVAATAALPWLDAPAAWGALRFVTGAGFSMLYILVESSLNAEASNADRGRLFAGYIIVTKLALIAGQGVVGAIGIGGWMPFAIAVALIATAGAIGTAAPRRQAADPSRGLRIGRVFRVAPSAAVGCFFYGACEGAFFALGPIYAREGGLDAGEIATVMAAFLLGGVALQWPLGLLSDRGDRRRVMAATALAGAVAALVLAVSAGGGVWALSAAALTLGALMLPLYGLCVALANDAARPDERLRISSGLIFAYAVGAVGGPPTAALLMRWDASGLPLLVGGALFAMAVAAMLSARSSPTDSAIGDLSPDLGPRIREDLRGTTSCLTSVKQ